MSRKKKGLALWLALFLGVSSLTGCGSGNDNMTQLSQKGADIMSSSDEEQDTDVEPLKTKTQLPEDGIITQAQMETIAGKDEKFYFVGKTDSGIGYKWTYNGSQIQNPVEQKLLVQCTEDGTEEIKKAANNAPYALKVTLEKMNLAAPAKLTLNLKEEWNADKVLYCLEENGKIYQLDTAKISTRESGKKKVKRTTLTFNVTKTGGDFYLIGGSTTGEAADDQRMMKPKIIPKIMQKEKIHSQKTINLPVVPQTRQIQIETRPPGRMVLLQTTVPGTHQAAETVRMKIQQ